MISFSDIPISGFQDILNRASKFKLMIKRGKRFHSLDGKIVGLLFEKPSTRTSTSFEAATIRLGGTPLYLSESEMQMKRGEPVKDTARVLGGYLNAIVARVFAHDTVVQLAKYSGLPTVNALSDIEHPTQLVSDMLTIYEIKGHIRGVNIAYIGDGNNVANSLLLAAAVGGANAAIACPKGYEPDAGILSKAEAIAKRTGSKISITHDVKAAAAGADVLYTDVWVSMGQEAETKRRLKAFRGYQINQKVVRFAAEDAIVMHCLPAHRGLEITDEVIEGRRSAVWQQAENKLYGAAAVLDTVINGPKGKRRAK